MSEIVKALLFPLLGGFLALLCNRRLRFSVLPNYSGERLIFICALIGAVSLIAASIVVQIVSALCTPEVVASAVAVRTKWLPFTAVNMLSMILPAVVALFANCGKTRQQAYIEHLHASGDAFETFLQLAARDFGLVMITLTGGRVYVGAFLETTPPMGPREFIKLIPFASGYRIPLSAGDHPTRVEFVTSYEDTINSILEFRDDEHDILRAAGRHAEFKPKTMGIIIRMSQIEVASRFDSAVFAYLNRDRLPSGWTSMSEEDGAATVSDSLR